MRQPKRSMMYPLSYTETVFHNPLLLLHIFWMVGSMYEDELNLETDPRDEALAQFMDDVHDLCL